MARPAAAPTHRLALAGLLAATAAFGVDPSDVLLYVPFGGVVEPAMARGEAKPVVRGTPRFMDGKHGQAYLSGRKGDALAYATAGNIDPVAGTVAMWVAPLGWTQKDPFMRFWLRVGETAEAGGKGSGSFLWLYKYLGSRPLYWLVQQDYRQRRVAYVGADDVYRPGQWTHLAASWTGPLMRLYVDGRRVGTARTLTPLLLRNFGSHLFVGGESWTPKGETAAESDSAIDELYVFARPLLAAELRAVAESGVPKEASRAPAATELETFWSPSTDRLTARLPIDGRRPGDLADLAVELRVRNGKGREVLSWKGPIAEVDGTVRLETGKLPAGRYRVEAVLKVGGKPNPPVAAGFEKTAQPAWLGNRLGMPRQVPKPWTAVTVKGVTAACWGRTVTWTDGPLPSRLTSAEVPLLAAPARLMRDTGHGPEPVRTTLKWTATTPLRASFTAAGDGLKASGWLDYDGFLWTELVLPPGAGTVKALRVELPLRPEVATLQHGGIAGGGQNQAPRNGRVYPWALPLTGQPFLWLGNERVGLQWSTGDDYCWENADRDRAISLAPGERECLLTITLIDRPTPLDRPLRYTIGLQPTPVRPMPADWRRTDRMVNGRWPIETELGQPDGPVWKVWYQKWSVQNEATRKAHWLGGYPAPGRWAKEDLAATNAEGLKPLLYWVPSWAWPGAPEYAAFHGDWNPDSPAPEPAETAGSSCAQVWRTVPSFRDWATWRVHESLHRNPWLAAGAAGLYLDVVQGFWGVDPRPDREGMLRTGHELLGSRELQQRVYLMLRDNWPDLRVINHQSGDTILSQLAFCDAYVTGENYNQHSLLGSEEGYYHILDLDACRAELYGAKWGVPIVFLPEAAPSGVPWPKVLGPEGIRPAEHLIGLLVAHDVIPWPANLHPLPFLRLAALKERFGWDEQTRFTGYWEAAELVQLTADQTPVVVSVYQRPGRVLFVVLNNSDHDAVARLAPDWSKLGLAPPASVSDAYLATGIPDRPIDVRQTTNTGQVHFLDQRPPPEPVTIPVTADGLTVPVPARGFRILLAGG